MDAQAELNLIDSAIADLLAGRAAEFGEGAHRAKLLDLKTLYQRKEDLQNQIAQQSSRMFLPMTGVRRER